MCTWCTATWLPLQAEVVQQGFPLRNFHRGCDFLELDAHQHPQAGPQRSSSGASGELPSAGGHAVHTCAQVACPAGRITQWPKRVGQLPAGRDPSCLSRHRCRCPWSLGCWLVLDPLAQAPMSSTACMCRNGGHALWGATSTCPLCLTRRELGGRGGGGGGDGGLPATRH